jgi:DNA polymerase-3 subunit beta
MKFKAKAGAVRDLLADITPYCAGKPVLPVLGYVLLTHKENMLRVSGTDLELGAYDEIVVQGETDGGFALPWRPLVEFLKALKHDAIVQFTLGKAGDALYLTADKFKTSIKGLPKEEFPILPSPNGGDFWTIDAEELKELMGFGAHSMAPHGDSRAVLVGVNQTVTKEGVTFASADGFRLSVAKKKLAGNTFEASFIIPRNLPGLLKAQDYEGSVKFQAIRMGTDGNLVTTGSGEVRKVMVQYGTFVAVTQIIEGKFPDFEVIVPKKWNVVAVLDYTELLKAIKVVGIVAKKAIAYKATWTLGEDSVKFFAKDADAGESDVTIPAEITYGEEVDHKLVIHFNNDYMIRWLLANKCETVTMSFVNAATGAMIAPDAQTDRYFIVMPMNLGAPQPEVQDNEE